MALTATQVHQFYVGYYGRPADTAGLTYWQAQTEAAALTGFSGGAEFTSQYAGLTTTAQVTKVYANLLGRAPDAAGLAYWSGELTAGRETIGSLLLTVIKSALGKDVTTIADRVQYSTNFAAALDTLAEINAYNGAAANALARTAMGAIVATTVDDHASLTTADAAINATVTSIVTAGVTGSNFSLTTATTDVLNGTSGNDTITGAVGTLQTGDVISDSSTVDADTLNISVSSYALAGAKPTIANIENINITGTVLASGIDLTNVTGAKTVSLIGSTSGSAGTVDLVAASKVANIVAGANIGTLTVNTLSTGTTSTGGVVNIDTGSATTTTITGQAGADTYAVKVSGLNQTVSLAGAAGVDTFSVTLPGAGTTSLQTDSGLIETLNLVSNGSTANTLALTSTSGTLLTGPAASSYGAVVSGTQNLTIATDLDNITGLSISKASGYTGKLALTSNATATAADVSKVLADTLNVTTALGAAAMTVNENTALKFSIDNTAVTVGVNNATGTLTTGTLNLDVAATQTAVTTAATVATLSLTNSAVVTIVTLTQNAITTAVSLTGTKDLTIGTLTIGAASAFVATGETGNLTISATTGAFASTVIGGSGNDSITVSTGTWASGNLRGGDGNDTITLASADTSIFAIDGGNGNDIIVGNAAATTILGGAGTDTITSGAGNIINGGDGVDTIILATAGNIETIRFGASSTWGDVISVFKGAEDVLAFSTSNGYASLSHGSTTGLGTVSIATTNTTVGANTTVQVNTTAVTGVTTASALQAAGWVITGEVAGNHIVVVQYNVGTTNFSVFDVVSANNDGLITAADTVTLVGTVSGITAITAADFSVA